MVGGWWVLVWFGTGGFACAPYGVGGAPGVTPRSRFRSKVAPGPLGRCGDTPGTPPSVRRAGASLRGWG
ncbi:hypothetical protein SCATT_02730 [Streptantibioticus cattleyicolor NRRL 8057 = DSM 46488]|uniref:Uncharacterized protein n=1 Tax=Streptantibioticus cattleyicolor (strain ATCC 35852 / DSM 46488 / JCM 4925 / NBRC 14057 / NRRL 8057) TaxID=1003195 RepID=G8WMS4_STREN|nr:hypothetical protein SCATT_02730 [Streptantibioticus cattleyicolor NRRL 8057 = DSM 46488]